MVLKLSLCFYVYSHELMLGCWRKKATDRPTFTDIKTYLEGLIEKEYGRLYIMLENDYEGKYVYSIQKVLVL